VCVGERVCVYSLAAFCLERMCACVRVCECVYSLATFVLSECVCACVCVCVCERERERKSVCILWQLFS